jgi:hypothetical protein
LTRPAGEVSGLPCRDSNVLKTWAMFPNRSTRAEISCSLACWSWNS